MARFNDTFCSQCGKGLGPGEHGASACSDHEAKEQPELPWDEIMNDIKEDLRLIPMSVDGRTWAITEGKIRHVRVD